MSWKITIKTVAGATVYVELSNPQATTVLDLKKMIREKMPSALVHLQRLVLQNKTVLEDAHKLTHYPALSDGAIIFLIIKTPFKLYIQDPLGKLHEITIPSQTPESYTIAQLRGLVEKTTGQRLDELQFQQKEGKVVEECRHGRQLTLQDSGIKKEDTLFLMKVGFVLDITDPQVDVCFLVDCTNSMSSFIESVKNNIRQLRDNLETQYRGCDLQFAFVRYTDYVQPAALRTSLLDFTRELKVFHTFVGSIKTLWGKDGPEDVMGGLSTALSRLSWRSSSSKVLIHIGDAPCHGVQYHGWVNGDDYPAGDPAGITHEQMMKKVVRLNIQYWFGYIRKSDTDKMINVFNDSLKRLSDNQMLIRQFEAVESKQIGEAVHSSVTASVFAAEAKKKLTASRRSVTTLSPSIPNWSSLPVLHAVKTPATGAKSFQSLQDGLTLEPPCLPLQIKQAPHPFTEGSECIVYHGIDVIKNTRIVLKELKNKSKDASLDYYMKILEIQTVASAYAREFNHTLIKQSILLPPTSFPPVDIVDMRDAAHTCYILQEFIDGIFEKFNTNAGIVCSSSPISDTLQAFSHYTWIKSGQSLLICDLQGVQTSSGVRLCDPAIHSKAGTSRYGPTDLGYGGIMQFFRTHRCTDTCNRMGLEPFRD